MPPFTTLRRLDAAVRRIRDARDGVAALEFAIILPVMLLLYVGMAQITTALSMDRKVTLLSRTVADLVGRAGEADAASLQDMMRAAAHVLAPYDPDEVSIAISSVVVEDDGDGGVEAAVCWSFANANGTVRTEGETMPIPAGFGTTNTSFILTQVRLPYRPLLSLDNLFSAITLSDDTVWPVRNSDEVRFDDTSCLPGGGAGT